MVLCYGAVFFLVVRFVAFTLLPKTVYLKSFWGPLGVILAPFGSILVALGSPGDPRGTPCRQKLIFNRFGEVSPPSLGSQFWYIFDKFLEKSSSRCTILWGSCSTPVFLQNCRKIAGPRPLKCSKTIVNTVSDAMSPCSHKSSENDGQRSILEVIWGHFGRQIGTKFDCRCFFFEVRILVEKRCLTQSPGAHRSPGTGRGGSLKELSETGGWEPRGWRLGG